jgi:hypothetical protein
MLLYLLALASTILASSAANDLTSRGHLEARDPNLRVYYYDDNACKKWTTYVRRLNSCYQYQCNGMNSANIVTCNYYSLCHCDFFSDDHCNSNNKVSTIFVKKDLSDQQGTHNCANAQGVSIRSMYCGLI